jgi:hypothetical protein
MDRLIAPGTVDAAHADVAPATGTPGFATDGNPATNTPATQWPAYAFNAVQEELLAVIAAGGLAFNRNNNAQLLAAIQLLIPSNAPGRLIGIRAITSTQVYNPTAGTKSVVVLLGSGGGAGGGASITDGTQISFGAGGSAGHWCVGRFTNGFNGVTVTIGAGGVPAAGSVGGTGGTSSFGSLMSVNGGTGGNKFGPTSPNLTAGASNSNVSAPGAILALQGESGGAGFVIVASNAGILGYSGVGAGSPFGNGGEANNSTGNGVSARGFCAGGSGAFAGYTNASNRIGGPGAPGFGLIGEYA